MKRAVVHMSGRNKRTPAEEWSVKFINPRFTLPWLAGISFND